MRTRDKQKVPVKAKCAGCGFGHVVADATVEPGASYAFECRICGAKVRKTIYQSDIDKAIAKYVEDKKFSDKVKSGEVQIKSARSTELAPVRTTDGHYKVAADASYGGTVGPRRTRSDQVEGAAKLYHYAIYVRHPWGTDRIVVGVKKRNIQMARDEAWDRVVTKRKTADLKIMDAVPMRWTTEGIVETRKTRIKTGELKNQRRPKSRVSTKTRKADEYQPRNRDDDDAPRPAPRKRSRSKKVIHVQVKGR